MNLFSLLPSPSILTGDDGEIIQYNQAFATMVGKSDQELIASSLEDFLPLAGKIIFQTHFWPLLRRNRTLREVYFLMKGESNSVPILANCDALQQEEKTTYIWVFFVATERQKFEAELIQARKDVEQANVALADSKKEILDINQELQEANQEMERFVYTVSHDIKAPLITIEGFTKKLTQELAEQISEKQRHRLERVTTNVIHLRSMIEELLIQSRLMRQAIEVEELDTNTLIKQQLGLLEWFIEEVGATFKVPVNLPNIIANKTLISQCIQNLLSNALTYRDEKRALVIEISATLTKQHYALHVKDNGIGIEKRNLTKVFDLFEHLDSDSGTGAGLSIVKTIMKKHGGRVEAESEPSVGSCFSLIFPLPQHKFSTK